MEYISTRNAQKTFSFKDVFLKGLAPDGGLFVPKEVPLFNFQDMKEIKNLSYKELATKIILKFCGDQFDENEIKNIVNISYKDFRTEDIVAIKKLGKLNLLELFYGPTLAFKDIPMQVIGNMYEKILKNNNLKINIIVATSGDTGAAAISAIKNKENMKIFVLYPDSKISEVQRKFMTTVNSKNVFNIAMKGNFDGCQKFIKLMFEDENFQKSLNISGVNSINWARIVFQIVYYFFSYFKIANKDEKINFAVPTGNFGDIYAGYIAKKMGLPINKLIIATNQNDILKRVVTNGHYKPVKAEHTISPSMDIQVASNFERLLFDVHSCDSNKIVNLMNDLNKKGEFKLQEKELKKIQESFLSESLSDSETKSVIADAYKNHKTLIDPHTAVAVGVAKKINLKNTVILSTAHPAKFSEVVENIVGKKPTLPSGLTDILNLKENYEKLPMNLEKVKNYILERSK